MTSTLTGKAQPSSVQFCWMKPSSRSGRTCADRDCVGVSDCGRACPTRKASKAAQLIRSMLAGCIHRECGSGGTPCKSVERDYSRTAIARTTPVRRARGLSRPAVRDVSVINTSDGVGERSKKDFHTDYQFCGLCAFFLFLRSCFATNRKNTRSLRVQLRYRNCRLDSVV